MTQLTADRVTLTYERKPVVRDLSLSIEPGTITTIIGPNGCGKSTLLRSLVRLMTPSEGSILLDGTFIDSVPTREVAKKLGLLSQHAIVPDGATVGDLVLLGRYPHQAFLQTPSSQDIKVVDHSLELAGMMELRDRPVAELSGGQRQRAWIAMALAQETPVLLLDEPTTFLDVAHQMEVMDLVVQLNREENRTIVMALHDINEAARVSDRLVAMRDGRIIGDGPPAEILTAQLLEELYGIDCDLLPHPTLLKCPNYCLPRSAMMRARAARDTSHGFNIVNARTSYGDRVVSDELSLNIPGGKITAIVGPNGCGKSTLMRACARLQRLGDGTINLNGSNVASGSHRALARKLAMLGQEATAPEDLLVEDVVAVGRTPHQTWLKRWTSRDEELVDWAINICGLENLRYREVGALSGGQRQRVWIAMALVQDTPVLLLDEPTTYLDIAAQTDLLDLIKRLNSEQGKTIVMVLHDINLAARYADQIVAMRDGNVIAQGPPKSVVTRPLLKEIFNVDADVLVHPEHGTPIMIPLRSVNSSESASVLLA